MRQCLVDGGQQADHRLPPAIRPGLHCGVEQTDADTYDLNLPPAIRPGLHCGIATVTFVG